MRLSRLLPVVMVSLAACKRDGGAGDAGAPSGELPVARAQARVRRDAGAGVLDLDAYLTFQQARLDAQSKKIPGQAARAAGLQASGLSEVELKQIDRVVLDVTSALEQARAVPQVAAIPELEKALAVAEKPDKAAVEAQLQEARALEAQAIAKALVPVRQKHGDDKVNQVLARETDLEPFMYYKANALVPLRE